MATSPTIARPFASFAEWSPDAYLSDYYRCVQPDEQVTMRFLGDAAALVGDVPMLLEFGCGPTVHHVIPFAGRADRIHVADYLDGNLDAVRRWVRGGPDAWDWTPFTRVTLHHELGRPPVDWEIREREARTRERITAFHLGDARMRRPLASARRYPAVLCCFCPDSITDDPVEWRYCTENVASLVAPGGWLVLTALHRASSYRVGGVQFPSCGVTADDVAGVLHSSGFSRLGTTIVIADADDSEGHGFDSVLLSVSRKS
jgi:nicotinamide N-methyltransferase